MGCLKLTYYQSEPQLKVVYRKPEPQEKAVQRWLNVDPMADSRSWVSPYSYCQNNPVGRVDPTGALDTDNIDGWEIKTATNEVSWDNTNGGSNTQHITYVDGNGNPTGSYKFETSGFDVMGSGNGTYIEPNANGKYQGGQSIMNPQVPSISGVSTGGSVYSFGKRGTVAIGLGVTFEYGVVLDLSDGVEVGGYGTAGVAYGMDVSFGYNYTEYKANENTTNFGIRNVRGMSENKNIGMWILDASSGGDVNNTRLFDKSFSFKHPTYKSNSYGVSGGLMPVSYTTTKERTYLTPTIKF